VWFLYILRCADDSLYIGETNDVNNRVKHNEGAASHYTAKRRPVHLAYSETYRTRAAALIRERQLKRWTRQKKEALIAADLQLLKKLRIMRNITSPRWVARIRYSVPPG
jgi:predicted GIY-YIG superfamily endonuclease